MTRLIDADELKEYLEEAYDAGCIDKYYNQRRRTIFDEVLDCVDEQPTVDAVQVIRCKDCKHFDTDTGKKGYYFCPMLDTFRRPEGYCDLAERKEE